MYLDGGRKVLKESFGNYRGIIHINSTLYLVQTIIDIDSFLNSVNIEAASDCKEFWVYYIAKGSFLVLVHCSTVFSSLVLASFCFKLSKM